MTDYKKVELCTIGDGAAVEAFDCGLPRGT